MKTKIINAIKNKRILGIILVSVISVIAVVLIINNMNKKILILKNEVFYVEYGYVATENNRYYLDTSSLDKDTKRDVLDNAVLNIDMGNELDKAFPKIGEYEASISYKNETVKFKIIVQDTVAPTMVDFMPYQFTYIDVIPNYQEIYKASDLSDCTVDIDDSLVNYQMLGNYEAVIKATDSYANVFSIKITVVVSEPILEVKQKDYTLTADDTVTLEVTIKGKEEKATFTSSDSNIVTVDENGNIVAINQGSAIIVVKANGKEETANITVNAKPVTTNYSSSGSGSSGNSSNSNTSNNSTNSNNSSANSDSGSTPSNTCTYAYTVVDDKFFSSEADMKNYFRNTYGAYGAQTHTGYDYTKDTCGRYYIYSIY